MRARADKVASAAPIPASALVASVAGPSAGRVALALARAVGGAALRVHHSVGREARVRGAELGATCAEPCTAANAGGVVKVAIGAASVPVACPGLAVEPGAHYAAVGAAVAGGARASVAVAAGSAVDTNERAGAAAVASGAAVAT